MAKQDDHDYAEGTRDAHEHTHSWIGGGSESYRVGHAYASGQRDYNEGGGHQRLFGTLGDSPDTCAKLEESYSSGWDNAKSSDSGK